MTDIKMMDRYQERVVSSRLLFADDTVTVLSCRLNTFKAHLNSSDGHAKCISFI